MYQSTPTLLPIATWGAILGISPLSLQQVSVSSAYTSVAICGQPTVQYGWGDNARTGREDIARAIATAEALLKEQLGFSVLPAWESEEVNVHDQDWHPEIYPWSGQAVRGMNRTQTLGSGYFLGGGQRNVTVISAGAAIVYTDADGDGYAERATVGPVATSVTDPNQIALFYRAADTPDGTAADDAWEIRPIKVSISGGAVTITFRRELAVKANLLTPLEPVAVDGTVAGNFLTLCDVYQRFTDPTTSVRFEWEPGGWYGCSCNGVSSCESCGYQVQLGCLLGHEDRNSIVRIAPATYADGAWSTAGWANNRAPDRTTAWYRAGFRDKSKTRSYYEMDHALAEAVTYLSCSLLERPICGCNNVASAMEQWRYDMAQSIGTDAGSTSWSVSPSDLDNPFGTRRGAVWAWKRIKRRAMGMALTG